MSVLPIGPHTKSQSVAFCRATDEAVSEVTPASQATVDNTFADVVGSTIDTENFGTIAYTCVNTGAQTICWKVIGGNDAAFADAVTVQASADILAAGIASYSSTAAVWRYYKIQVSDKVNGQHGAATVRGIAKAY
jgi:hypothetical protein